MKTSLDCYSCYLRIGLQAARLGGADEATQKKLMLDFLDMLKNAIELDTPLATARHIQEVIYRRTGCVDPYLSVKEQCNREAEKWLPLLQGEVASSADKLNTALKIAAIGNIMDYGAFAAFDVSALIDKLHHQDFTVNCGAAFRQALESARTITYFADNTGEIYFDSVLIDHLCARDTVAQLNLVIRSHPFLNDVSSEDHLPAALKQHPKVKVASLPVVRAEHEPRLWQELTASDLIISKGMANFENYSEELGFFYLFICKCDLVARVITDKTGESVKTGDWILMGGAPRE